MENATYQKSLLDIQKRLELLNCPYLEDGSEQFLAELLLHPSEGRIRLLSWMLVNFDSKFGEILDESIPVISNRIDSRHQKLLLALNIMGVTKIDDLELIRGTASQKKQLLFWDELVDLVYTSRTGHPYMDISNLQDTSYCLKPIRDPSIKELYGDSCKFIDTLVREYTIKDLYSAQLNLFSPDLESIIKDEMKGGDIPSLKTLADIGVKMCSDLNDLTIQFEVISNDRINCVMPEQSTVDNYCRIVDLSLKTFSQTIDSFLYCHENDLASWCSKEKPVLSDIGPNVKSVSNMMKKQFNLIESVKLFSLASSYLCEEIKKEFNPTSKIYNKINDSNERETCSILQNGISRRRLSNKV